MATIALFFILLALALFMDFRALRALYTLIPNRRALNPEANRKK